MQGAVMSIRDVLEDSVANWARLGHPALLERFVLRNGKAYAPCKRIGRKCKAKQCFANATHHVLDAGGTYVEGFMMKHTLALPLQHAWVTIHGDDAMDPTLESNDYEYFGVAFDKKTLTEELVRNGYYGLLESGICINTQLIFKIDPELKDICEQVKLNRRRA
jgi:hypothetical protein